MIPAPQAVREETVAELEARKQALLSDIGRLGNTKEGLDLIVTNHEATKAEFTEAKKEIEVMKQTTKSLELDIAQLSNTKRKLTSELNVLDDSIKEKTKLYEEVTKLKAIIKVLREEEDMFTKKHLTAKTKSDSITEISKTKLLGLKTDIETVISQL